MPEGDALHRAAAGADEIVLDVGFPAAQARLVNLARRGGLSSASKAAHADELSAVIRVGPFGDAAAASKLAESLSPWPGNGTVQLKAVQDKIKGFVEAGQLGIFTNGYWGHPAMKLPPEVNLLAVAHGALSIGEADFGRVPVVGPLHFVFNVLAPRFHTDEPSTMTVNHRMAGSILHLEDLKLVSEHASIQAGGTIDLAREYTQLTARGGLRKLPGLITVLFTSLLEFKGEGPVDNVRWSIKGFPGFHPVVNAPKKTARTEADAAEKEADRAVKSLIELPGKVLEDK